MPKTARDLFLEGIAKQNLLKRVFSAESLGGALLTYQEIKDGRFVFQITRKGRYNLDSEYAIYSLDQLDELVLVDS